MQQGTKGDSESRVRSCFLILSLLLLVAAITHLPTTSSQSNPVYQQYTQYVSQRKPTPLQDQNIDPTINEFMNAKTLMEVKNQQLAIQRQDRQEKDEEKDKREQEPKKETTDKDKRTDELFIEKRRVYKPKKDYLERKEKEEEQEIMKKKEKERKAYDLPKINPSQIIKNPTLPILQIMKNEYKVIKKPIKYYDTDKIFIYRELPICIVVAVDTEETFVKIERSIKEQEYGRKKIVKLETKRKNGYYQYLDLFERECEEFSVIMFTQSSLKRNSLKTVNEIYQTHNVWATYSMQGQSGYFHIQSFYLQLFRKIEKNDFTNKNRQYLAGKDFIMFTILSIFQLSKIHLFPLDNVEIYKEVNQPNRKELRVYITASSSETFPQMEYYQTLYSLSQNFPINQQTNYKNLVFMLKSKYEFEQHNSMTREEMVRAIQYKQLKSLDKSHYLFLRERLYYRRKYWRDWKNNERSRFCVIIISHNNIQNDRYEKVLKTLKYQEYKNYHIVFIDDNSDDETFEKSRQYAFREGWKENTDISFIKNDERKYSTYNIKNAAENYCLDEEIMVLLDGDDELIGTQIFKLLNSFYVTQSKHEYWIVYTTFFSNLYTYGTSKHPIHYNFDLEQREKRHIMGALRSFKRSLYEKVKMDDHKDRDGRWLDTLYDEAMQYPMMEMAGPNRLKFLPQICYLYNKNYGDNDDSTEQKIEHRSQIFMQILERQPYQRLQSLK